MLSWDLIEICWIYFFFAVVEFVLGMMLFVDDGEKTQGSLKFQSRFTRPLKPFFHHSHGPQHAPSGSTRGVFLCSYFIQQGFLPPVNICIDFMKDSFGQIILYLIILCDRIENCGNQKSYSCKLDKYISKCYYWKLEKKSLNVST